MWWGREISNMVRVRQAKIESERGREAKREKEVD